MNIVRAVVLFAVLAWAQTALAKDITLNFKDADIRAVIEFVAGFTGKNFLIDSRVKGTVTIVSPKPIPEEHAYDVFLSVLEVNGYVAVPSGSVVKIVPRAEAKQEALPVSKGKLSGSDGMVTQVLRLEHADAQQLVSLLSPLISSNSHLVAYPAGNMLILTDSASNIARIRSILDLVDQAEESSVKVYKLAHASADKLAQTLTTLYATTGTAGQGGRIKAIAQQPGNQLIVVSPPQLGREIAQVIARLDSPPERETGSLQVRYLKNANATDVAKVLNELVGNQRVPASQNANSKPLFTGDVKIVAEPATNALLITADPGDMQSINHIIDKLDIRRLQVLIEALIVEVSGNDVQQLGVDWMANQPIRGGPNSVVGGQNYGNGIGSAVTLGNQIQNNPAAASLPTGLNIGVLHASAFGGIITMGAVVQALESTGDTNILSTPNILTMDNEEAEIIVGQNVPFVTGQNATQGGTAVPFQTIERKDIGLKLKVTPQISEGDTIRLDIYQEVSGLSTVTGASDLVTTKRSVKTVALASDRQMLVLGGLMREDTTSNVRRVPCLGAVPLAGEPFQSTQNTRVKTNLMVFLRPTIVRSDDDIQTITQEKYLDIKDLYEHPSAKGTILFQRQRKELPKDLTPPEPGSTQPDATAPAP